MGAAYIIFRQTIVMFLYMFAGYILFKTGIITVKGSRDIASLLIWLVIPAMIVSSFCVPFSSAKLSELFSSALVGALCLAVAVVVSMAVFKNDPIADFGCLFCNAGFIGIPLVQAALGEEAVFWLVGFIVMLNLLGWGYGVRVITGKKADPDIKSLLANPMLIAAAIGLIIFFTGLGAALPDVITTAIKGIASVNAPLAMIVLGSYLAQSDIKKMLTSLHIYWVSAVRLLVIPAVTLVLLKMLPFDRDIIMTVFVAASTPIGANVAIYAQLHDCDYPYACQIVTHSTLLTIVTLPLMIMLAEAII